MLKKRILCVQSDPAQRSLRVFGLRCAGFNVDETATLAEARVRIARRFPDLLLIGADTLPSGLARLLATLRGSVRTAELRVVLVAARPTAPSAVAAFESGVDDYLVEPVSPEELIARINAVLRGGRPHALSETIEFGKLRFDRVQSRVSNGAQSEALGPTESRILEFFLTHPERPITRDVLVYRVWGGTVDVDRRTVDVCVCRLRKALKRLRCAGHLRTVREQGYLFSAET
jgi:two-component system phosphate regulon response regulator PhoB